MSLGKYKIYGQENIIQNYIEEFGLGGRGQWLISVVGAGGKSTLIEAISDDFIAHGKSVLITTTTHIRKPNNYASSLNELDQLLKDTKGARKIYFGIPVTEKGTEKLKAPEEDVLTTIIEKYHMPILIEADGARGKHCKAPAEYEPVIRPESDIVIGVVSSECIGGKIAEKSHRPEMLSRLLKKGINDIITDKDLETIFYNSDGLMKGITQGMKYIPVLRVG